MSATILILDNAALDGNKVSQCLTRAGYPAIRAGSRAEAIILACQQPLAAVIQAAGEQQEGARTCGQLRQIQPHVACVLIEEGPSGENNAASDLPLCERIPASRIAAALPACLERLLEKSGGAGASPAPKRPACEIHRFVLDNNRNQIPPLVGQLVDLGRRCGAVPEEHECHVTIALEEALLNAVIHGNLEVTSELRETDHEAFEALIELRRCDPRYGERRVSVECRLQEQEVQYVISDQGPGFAVGAVPDPTEDDYLFRCSGRGILLMRSFMSRVDYNDRGNEVKLTKRGLCHSASADVESITGLETGLSQTTALAVSR